MTKQEYSDWLKVTESSRHRWTRDVCNEHNRNLVIFAYIGGESAAPGAGCTGNWVEVDRTGKVELGTYRDAVPHIGDALFHRSWSHQFKDADEAVKTLIERGGLKFLLDVIGASA